jgi:hypothetical protein
MSDANEEFEFVRITIERSQWAEVLLKVPKGWLPETLTLQRVSGHAAAVAEWRTGVPVLLDFKKVAASCPIFDARTLIKKEGAQ